MVKEFNVETQEEVTREMNDFEYEQLLIANAESEEQAAKQVEEDAKAAAKAEAKAEALAALGLTQEAVNLLAE
jgi:hypothetical protein